MERVDCHCHIFNIVNIGIKAILEQMHQTELLIIQHQQESVSVRSVNIRSSQDTSIFDKIKHIALLINVFSDNSNKILDKLDSYYNSQYKLFPLVFDADFLLKDFNDSLHEGHFSFIHSLLHHSVNDSLLQQDSMLSTVELFHLHGKEHAHVIVDFLRKSTNHNQNVVAQSGFEIQYTQMLDIVKLPKYKNKIFPFLGVDPRREGIFDLVKKLVGKNKPFAGIKVYPPNGFSPTDKVLVGKDSIFEYCNLHRIPIVCHNSYGGFATPIKSIPIQGAIMQNGTTLNKNYNGIYNFTTGIFDGFNTMVHERASVLNHPIIWEQVLEMYPNLILVLSHFGSENTAWQQKIKTLMAKYTFLYTDVSCMSNDKELQQVIAIYNEKNKEINDKILYGSDFYLDLFFNNNFSDYFNRMHNAFKDQMFDKFSSENPAKYMNTWYNTTIL